MTALTYDIITSNIVGPLIIVCSDKGIRMIKQFQTVKQAQRFADDMPWQRDIAAIAPIASQLSDYFDGSLTDWSVSLDLQGTDMQQKVWHELWKVPYGQTISYTELAARSGYPKAMRAVGSACGKNPVPIIVPCHRIVAKDGGLGGFAWGLPVKQRLLALESNASLKQAA